MIQRADVLAPLPPPMSFGLYLHIPFCVQHCHYCTFPIAIGPRSEHEPYVGRLLSEMAMAGVDQDPDTVYLGGGTPSLLSADQIARLLDGRVNDAVEVSIEMNPGTTSESAARWLREIGIDRVSLGAQSFDPEELRQTGRLHSPDDIVTDFDRLRHAGFSNISIDLIAGMPGQRPETWMATLDRVDSLSPDHVSIYLLELEDSALWVRQGIAPPGDDAHALLYERALERLDAMGYVHYETSSWARPGAECRHNIAYWTGVAYRGVGMGAHSFVGGRRFWNVRDLSEYNRRIDAGQLPIAEAEDRTARIRLEEAFLLGLRRMAGFDIDAVARDLGIEYPPDWFERVDQLQEAGLVSFDGRRLKLAPAGFLLATSVTEELLCPSLLSICEATR